jgi:cephalosporin hydroxylase
MIKHIDDANRPSIKGHQISRPNLKYATSKWDLSIIDVYEILFDPFKHQQIKLLEVGVYFGESTRYFREFFTHPDTVLVGLDYDGTLWEPPEDLLNIFFRKGNQDDPVLLDELGEEYGPFEIIIDDASHDPDLTELTFQGLWKYLKSGGENMTKEELHDLWQGRWIENYPEEMFNLIKIVEEQVKPLTTIIEVGVKHCGTLRVWEKLVPAKEGMVVGVDMTSPEQMLAYSGKYSKKLSLRPGHGDPNKVTFWDSCPADWIIDPRKCTVDCYNPSESDRQIHFATGESTSVDVHEKIKSVLGDRKADFIFHDGGHTGDIPLKDFDNIVQPFLRSGGLFALADGPRTEGGNRLYKNLPPSLRPVEIVPPDRVGIVLWWKP